MNWTCFLHRDGLEDPLDDAGLVQQQLDQLSTIGRCEYEKTCALLVQLFDQAAQTYQELLQSTNSNTVDVTVQEGMLSSHNCSTNFISTVQSSLSTGCRAVTLFRLYKSDFLFSDRSLDVVGLYNRGSDRRTGIICEYRWAGRHGWRVSLQVRVCHSWSVLVEIFHNNKNSWR